MLKMLLPLLTLATSTFALPSVRRRAPAGVPQYAVEYAPIAYLYSGENYFPSDIGNQLVQTRPEVNYTLISNAPNPLTLNNLNALNSYGDNGAYVYLTSKDDVTTNPSWLRGVPPNAQGQTTGATSCAVIVNDHGSGHVDVFYFYFYAYNFGGIYFGLNVDDHVGDWEYTMVRFLNGVPQAVWYSQHTNGEAFIYDVVEKYNNSRPVVYVANGTHANYAITGNHDHTIPDVNLPYGPIEDHTDQGALWDPIQSAYWYSFDAATQTFTAYAAGTPINWLYYRGQWGDKQYNNTDPHQSDPLGISALTRYTGGPDGPIDPDKSLNRTQVCPNNGVLCIVRVVLGP